MTNLLILLTLPEPIRGQYCDRLKQRFPALNINSVDHHSKAGPHIGSTDALLTFAPMLSDKVLEAADNLKWVQALGTGTDNLIDRPCLRKDVIVTNIHGSPVSEAAMAAMLALARNVPRAVRFQDKHQWTRFPAQLLYNKTVGIFGAGVIAAAPLSEPCYPGRRRGCAVGRGRRARWHVVVVLRQLVDRPKWPRRTAAPFP
jgi:phosphoglycerate dehydrogenase-like enzyme